MDKRPTGADAPHKDPNCISEDEVCCREENPVNGAESWRACVPGPSENGRCEFSCADRQTGCTGSHRPPASGIPLAIVGTGRKVKLLALQTGRECAARLAAMGLVPGAEIEIVRNAAHGPFVVAVKGSRVMLGRGVAQRVIVG